MQRKGAKGFRSKKTNGQIFEPKMFDLPLYLRNAARQHKSRATQMAKHTKCARNGKRKGREERKKIEINAGSNRKKKKKKKKKKISMRIHFPTLTPAA